MKKLITTLAAILAICPVAFASRPPDTSPVPAVQSVALVEIHDLPVAQHALTIDAASEHAPPDVPQVDNEPSGEPATIGTQWSLSGKWYATTTRALFKDIWVDGLDFVGVAGFEMTTGVPPSVGVGFAYHLGGKDADLDLGVFVLAPQKGRLDVAIGFQLRF